MQVSQESPSHHVPQISAAARVRDFTQTLFSLLGPDTFKPISSFICAARDGMLFHRSLQGSWNAGLLCRPNMQAGLRQARIGDMAQTIAL